MGGDTASGRPHGGPETGLEHHRPQPLEDAPHPNPPGSHTSRLRSVGLEPLPCWRLLQSPGCHRAEGTPQMRAPRQISWGRLGLESRGESRYGARCPCVPPSPGPGPCVAPPGPPPWTKAPVSLPWVPLPGPGPPCHTPGAPSRWSPCPASSSGCCRGDAMHWRAVARIEPVCTAGSSPAEAQTLGSAQTPASQEPCPPCPVVTEATGLTPQEPRLPPSPPPGGAAGPPLGETRFHSFPPVPPGHLRSCLEDTECHQVSSARAPPPGAK